MFTPPGVAEATTPVKAEPSPLKDPVNADAVTKPCTVSECVGAVFPIPTFALNIVFVTFVLPKVTLLSPLPTALSPITISLFVLERNVGLAPTVLYPMYIDDVTYPAIVPAAFDPIATFLFPSAPNSALYPTAVLSLAPAILFKLKAPIAVF